MHIDAPGIERDVYGAQQPTVDFVRVLKPAAGANASYSFSRDFAIRVLAARAMLDTDANAANRLVSLDFLPGGAFTAVRNTAAIVITANTTDKQVLWSAQYANGENAANAPLCLPVLDAWLPCPIVVQFTLDNVQVGDQLDELTITVVRRPA
jgi:hypothetical protein